MTHHIPVAMYAPPPLPQDASPLLPIQTTIAPQILLPRPIDIIKNEIPKLNRNERGVLRKLLDAYDAIEDV